MNLRRENRLFKTHFTMALYQFDPNNGLRGYTELLTFIETEFKDKFKYNTLLKYCVKNFNSKIKNARKSHVKKEEAAVKTFKKTLVKPAKSGVQRKKLHSKA